MVDVEISDNVCLDNGCGVLLAERNRLDNCTAFRNRVIDADDQHSSLLDAPESSTTTIEGFRATKNRITVIRIRKGVLSLSNALFRRNSLDLENEQVMKSPCVHFVESSAVMSSVTVPLPATKQPVGQLFLPRSRTSPYLFPFLLTTSALIWVVASIQ